MGADLPAPKAAAEPDGDRAMTAETAALALLAGGTIAGQVLHRMTRPTALKPMAGRGAEPQICATTPAQPTAGGIRQASGYPPPRTSTQSEAPVGPTRSPPGR